MTLYLIRLHTAIYPDRLLTVLIEHLLKLSYWESEKERNARHWIVEIGAFRAQLEQKIEALRYLLWFDRGT